MAIISPNNKFCFIHVNNTGGTTITYLLKKHFTDLQYIGDTYCTIKQVLDVIPEANDYYKFAYVRHPYDWLNSMYSHIYNNGLHPDNKLVKQLDFYEFIIWLGDVGLKRNSSELPIYKKQSDYLFTRGHLFIDKIYRYEELCNDIGLSNANSVIMTLCNIMPEEIPLINKSNRAYNWFNLLNFKTLNTIHKLFKEDFYNLKYKQSAT
jgi:hypothetical protein